jgi:hypothetical protein
MKPNNKPKVGVKGEDKAARKKREEHDQIEYLT